MSLKLNVVANYVSQIYATLLGIVMVPLYLKTMGAEAYGLVGFFSMLQAWFNVLDLGLTPTIARESARFFGGVLEPLQFRRLYRALSAIFVIVAIVGGGALYMASPNVATAWLHVHEIPLPDVVAAVQIMAASVALRWMAGLYRGVITGAERLVWLAGFNAGIATLRFVAVFVSMVIWGSTPAIFFWHQLAVAFIELVVLLAMTTRLIPVTNARNLSIGWSLAPIRPLLRFSLTIAFTSSVWVFVTQTDKLIISGLVSLTEYGIFTLAALLAGGITMATGPISTALLPRLTRLHAEDKRAEILALYSQFGQITGVVAFSLAATLVCCAEPLLFAWTGDRDIAEIAAPILRLYAIGNALLALAAFPFYLQYAGGDLRYHLFGNVGMVVILIPAIVIAATRAGGVGAGVVWAAMNVIYLFFWVRYVHGRLEPGLHASWIRYVVAEVGFPTGLVSLVAMLFIPAYNQLNRLESLIISVFFGLFMIAAATLSTTIIRPRFLRMIGRCTEAIRAASKRGA